MTSKSHLTTGEVAELLGVPVWLARRAVDAVGANIPRAGLYRLVPRELLPKLRAHLQKRERAEVADAES